MDTTKIKILPAHVANLIAAGEVVERPASVIKELIENALDANATQIEVEIREAGLSYMSVSDNGTGMEPEDAKLAFSRHATSKLEQAEDLNHIVTMGFRGEALPSIASVSRFQLMTRPHDQSAGFELVIEGGKVQQEGEVGCSAGTTIKVKDLFFNTPARRKFMKSKSTEQSHITQIVELTAMVHLNVRFKLTVDNRVIYNCPVTNDLEERLAALQGKALPKDLYEVEREGGGVWVKGLIAGPGYVKPNRQGIRLFINKRPVDHRGLTHAVVQAYKTIIPDGKFPIAFIKLDIPAALVDVNVHPAKREVRLQDEHAMFLLVMQAVKEALKEHDLTKNNMDVLMAEKQLDAATASRQESSTYKPNPLSLGWNRNRVQESIASYMSDQPVDKGSRYHPTVRYRPASPLPPSPAHAPHHRDLPSTGDDQPKQDDHEENVIRIVGQMGRLYIVGEDREGFFIVDQHAAHERVLFEQFKAMAEKEVVKQPLLIPIEFEVQPSQKNYLDELLDFFNKLGYDISPMGGNSYNIQSQPGQFENDQASAVVQDVLDAVAENNAIPDMSTLQDELLLSMACHNAIKAGDRLQPEVMKDLILKTRDMTHLPTCPHGRPYTFRLGWQELEKYFKRDYRD